jgi:DNA gyrase/topoisomerase IV subunit A
MNIVFEGETEVTHIPVTLGMLTKNDERINTMVVTDADGDNKDVYTGVTVSYGGMMVENFTLEVLKPVGDENPPYPEEGSVQVDKTGAGVNFTSTGVAQIELSATGVPVRTGADVIIMLDSSGSMAATVEGSGGKTRRDVLIEALNDLIDTLQQPDALLLTVTEQGYGKRTDPEEFTVHHRGGGGMTAHNLTAKTGDLVGLGMIREDEDLLLINSSGVVIRTPAESIRQCGRASQGVILIRLDEGDKVISGTCAKREEEDEVSAAAPEQAAPAVDAE